MVAYVASFQPEDRERLFRFLALFARWECALKHTGFVRAGHHGQAEPNWTQFARSHEVSIAALSSPSFTAARDVLLRNPPKREEVCGNAVEWRPNLRRQNETDASYLFRVVRDVRNNLFHGGKYAQPEPELGRDRELIDSAIAVLEAAVGLEPSIEAMLESAY